MLIAPKDLKPGATVVIPPVVAVHVTVIGPRWEPREVWVEDTAGRLHQLDPLVPVECSAS